MCLCVRVLAFMQVGARLDRNGLRPARFWRTKDDMIYVASEVGVLNNVMKEPQNVVAKGRLGPGQMIVADLEVRVTHKRGSGLSVKGCQGCSLVQLADRNLCPKLSGFKYGACSLGTGLLSA